MSIDTLDFNDNETIIYLLGKSHGRRDGVADAVSVVNCWIISHPTSDAAHLQNTVVREILETLTVKHEKL